MATDATGRLYITEPRNGRLVVRDDRGRLLALAGSLAGPIAVAASAGGHIYVAESGTGSVSVLDANLGRLRKLGAGDGEFRLPNDVAVDPQTGLVWVSDGRGHAVRVYGDDGGLVRVVGSQGTAPGQLDFPAGVWVSSAGEVFVSDQGNSRIQVFDRNGVLLRCFPTARGRSDLGENVARGHAITGDSRGRIYVADAFQDEILVFDRLGAQLGVVGSFGQTAGKLWTPTGLALDRHGRLVVSSVNNGRLEMFGIDGFEDPRLAAATVGVAPDLARSPTGPRYAEVRIEVPGRDVRDIVPGTVSANGVFADGKWVQVVDRGGGAPLELRVRFDQQALVATLPETGGVVLVNGGFGDGTGFEGANDFPAVPR